MDALGDDICKLLKRVNPDWMIQMQVFILDCFMSKDLADAYFVAPLNAHGAAPVNRCPFSSSTINLPDL